MKEDGYIGLVYKSKYGTELTVQEKIGDKYVCTCEVCSKDEELWPYGSITNSRHNIRNKGNSCGCVKSPSWTKEQYEIIVKRKCARRGWEFIGFNGEFLGSKTLITMRDCTTGSISDTVTINNLDKIVGFPTTRYKRTSERFKKTLESYQEELNQYSEGRVVEDRDGEKVVHCPVCKEQGYVGVYPIKNYQLRDQTLPCSCNKSPFLQEDKVVQVKNECIRRGFTFIGLTDPVGSIKANSTRVIYECKEKHYNDSTTISSFLYGAGCNQCHLESRSWNYYRDRLQETDYLYLLRITHCNSTYYKIGRSFDISDRVRKLCKYKDISEIEVLDFVENTHENVFFAEVKIHKQLGRYSINLPLEGGTEIYDIIPCVRKLFYEVKHELVHNLIL